MMSSRYIYVTYRKKKEETVVPEQKYLIKRLWTKAYILLALIRIVQDLCTLKSHLAGTVCCANTLFLIFVLSLGTMSCCDDFEYGYYKDDGACFSPDGDYIAFAHTEVIYQESDAVDSLVSGIYSMKLDGTELQLVCEGLGNTVDWSHDGKMLVFNAHNELWLYMIERDSLMQLTNNGAIKHSARFSPDGQRIVYFQISPEEGGIHIIDVSGENDYWVSALDYAVCGPDWFESGNRFLFVGWLQDSTYPEGTTVLCCADTTGENLVQFLTAEDMQFVAPTFAYPRVSPDQKKVLFHARKEGEKQNYEIWKVDIDGENPIQLTHSGGADPCWSPDGEWILFSDGSTGGLSLMRSDGSDRQSITGYD